jgi:CYTH domain-containing protein
MIMGTEIERKFLVDRLPDSLDVYPHTRIHQGYLIATDSGMELRIRQKAGRFYQTVKTGEGLSRTEIEIFLSKDQFDDLWPHTTGRRVSKMRFNVPVGDYVTELDRFEDDLTGLLLVEVEFLSVEESRQFEPPEWFGAEVTNDKRYKNKWLAINGVPEK